MRRLVWRSPGRAHRDAFAPRASHDTLITAGLHARVQQCPKQAPGGRACSRSPGWSPPLAATPWLFQRYPEAGPACSSSWRVAGDKVGAANEPRNDAVVEGWKRRVGSATRNTDQGMGPAQLLGPLRIGPPPPPPQLLAEAGRRAVGSSACRDDHRGLPHERDGRNASQLRLATCSHFRVHPRLVAGGRTPITSCTPGRWTAAAGSDVLSPTHREAGRLQDAQPQCSTAPNAPHGLPPPWHGALPVHGGPAGPRGATPLPCAQLCPLRRPPGRGTQTPHPCPSDACTRR